MTRSFLTNDSVNTLFFFLIFFIHMLLPLAMGVALWLHIVRINKSKFFTDTSMTAVIVVSLILISLIYPASSAKPAEMQSLPQNMTMDWFYLAPLFLTDRLQGGALWLILLGGGALLLSIPWWMARKQAKVASVVEKRCNGCQQCYDDCPYNAITMFHREGRHPLLSHIDPAKCVACGVCIGSCDSAAILSPQLPALEVRKWVNQYSEKQSSLPQPFIAFLCSESAGSELKITTDGECDELPGYKIIPVPCTAWVQPLLIERAIRRGAAGVLIVGCSDDPVCRTGNQITRERLNGEREPFLRLEKVKSQDICYLEYNRSDKKNFLQEAEAFRQGKKVARQRFLKSKALRYALTAVLLTALSILTLAGSDSPYWPVSSDKAELVVTFKHPGQLIANDAPEKSEKQEELLPHMRGMTSKRRVRVAVWMRIVIDGQEILHKAYPATGFFKDGNSVAVESVLLDEGTHSVQVFIRDGNKLDEWSYSDQRTIQFEKSKRGVVRFDKLAGFQWD